MIFRITALSLALIIGICAILPLTTHNSEASAPKPTLHKKIYKKFKKFSKKWWQAYRNRLRHKKTLNARKRMLRLRRIRLANARETALQNENQHIANTAPAIQTGKLFILVEGKIKKVFDGDTINVESREGKLYTVRMLGADSPELNQHFGDKSQKTLSDLILGKEATVIIRKKNSAGLYIGTVYSGGEDINFLQIETGMARYFRQSGYEPVSGDRKSYELAEQKARAKRKGLWAIQKSNNVLAIKK